MKFSVVWPHGENPTGTEMSYSHGCPWGSGAGVGVLWGDIDVLPQVLEASFLEAGAGCKEGGCKSEPHCEFGWSHRLF